MMKKFCPKCEEDKLIDEFPINKSRGDGRGRVCKKCQNEYTRNHYKKNKKQYLKRNRRRTKEAKEYIIEYKKKNKCRNCPEDRWWVLDFHHVDEKKEDVVNLISHGIEMVKKEIEKCEVLCANCHRDLHFHERQAPVA